MKRHMAWMGAVTPAGVAILVLIAGASWQSTRLAREHHELQRQLAAVREVGGKEVAQEADEDAAEADIAGAREELTSLSSRLEQAEAKLKTAEMELPRLSGEELRSLGRIETLAGQAAEFIEQVAELSKVYKGNATSKERDQILAKFTPQMGKWASWLQVIGEMEESPAEIAQLHALTIAERLGLDSIASGKLQEQIAAEFTDLAALGLTRSHRPPAGSPAEEWTKRRSEVMHAAAARLEKIIPDSQRQPWVVEQSLQLGDALRHQVSINPDGHGSAAVAVLLPGLQM